MCGSTTVVEAAGRLWQFGDVRMPVIYDAGGLFTRSPRNAGPHLIRMVTARAGSSETEHVHSIDHWLLMLAGRVTLTLSGCVLDMLPGSIALIPAGTPHAVEYVSNTSLIVLGPGGSAVT